MTGNLTRNLKNCAFVKSALMLMVILGHSVAFWSKSWFTIQTPAFDSMTLSTIFTWLNSFHIYAFALVSGYIFAFKIIGGGV